MSHDGEYAAVGSVEGLVYVWSMKMGIMVAALKQHRGPVVCCSWSGGGHKLATIRIVDPGPHYKHTVQRL